MKTRFITKCIALVIVVLTACSICGCSSAVYTPVDLRTKGQEFFNYTSDGSRYIDYSLTYESTHKGTTTSKIIVSGISDGEQASVTLTDETNAIEKVYNDLAVLNHHKLYINADPVLNLLEDREIFVSAAPDYYSKKIIEIDLSGVSEQVSTLLTTVQSTALDALKNEQQKNTIKDGEVLALDYTTDELCALLTAAKVNLENKKSEIESEWGKIKNTIFSESFKTRWKDINTMDNANVFDLPDEVSVYAMLWDGINKLINSTTEQKLSGTEKMYLSMHGNCADYQYRWIMTSGDGDTTYSLLFKATEISGKGSVSEYSSDYVVSIDDFSDHVFDELRDILTGNYESNDIFDDVEVVGDTLHVKTTDDAADIEYIFSYDSKHVSSCEIQMDIYDRALYDALKAHYAEKEFLLIEDSVDALREGTGGGRLVVRSSDKWPVPDDVASTQSPAELSSVIAKFGILI